MARHGRYRVLVALEEPGVLDVAASSYWLVSPAGGRIHLYACPDVTISNVAAVTPNPREGFGSRRLRSSPPEASQVEVSTRRTESAWE